MILEPLIPSPTCDIYIFLPEQFPEHFKELLHLDAKTQLINP